MSFDANAANASVEPISLIVPVRNEAENLPTFLPKVRPYADEIIVVDGHSTDDSFAIAGPLSDRVLRDHHRGKGDALRCGAAASRHDIIVFIDADFSHDPSDIPKLVEPIRTGQALHVQGSRMLGGSDELFFDFANYVRLFGSVLITMSINWRFGVRLTDSQNGFRAMRRSLFFELATRESTTTIEQEMIIKTLRRVVAVWEVPTHEYRRRGGVSKVSVRRQWPRYIYSWLRYLLVP
jgi:glycosyltransferase involved in cell wall biosynthesis